MSIDGFVALDIETTGLNEDEGEILEVGVAVYDLDFRLQTSQSYLVFNPLTFICIENKMYDEYIMKMHTKSGLFDDIMVYQKQEGVRADSVTVQSRLVSTLKSWGVDRKTPMVGSSLAFDRRWLAKFMPEVNELFSYRSIDVSSDMEYLKKKYPKIWKQIELEGYDSRSGSSHRVLDDIADSMNLLKRIDKHVYSKAAQ